MQEARREVKVKVLVRSKSRCRMRGGNLSIPTRRASGTFGESSAVTLRSSGRYVYCSGSMNVRIARNVSLLPGRVTSVDVSGEEGECGESKKGTFGVWWWSETAIHAQGRALPLPITTTTIS